MGRKKSVPAPKLVVEDVPEGKPARVRNERPPEPVLKFSTWFATKALAHPKVKPHHSDTLRAYILSMGLSDAEPARRYDAALRTYFGG